MINMSQAKKWSCCKEINPDAPGCRVGYHEEDTEFTDFLCESYSNINRCSQTTGPGPKNTSLHLAPRESRDASAPEEEEEEEEERKRELDKENCPSGYQRHQVNPTDTLKRLELAYDTTAEAIKAANQLVTDRDMYSREYLLIPSLKVPTLPPPPELTKEARESRKVSLFLSIIKCDSFEARYYLDSHDWDVDASVKAYREDMQWESNMMEREYAKQGRVCC